MLEQEAFWRASRGFEDLRRRIIYFQGSGQKGQSLGSGGQGQILGFYGAGNKILRAPKMLLVLR